MKILSIVGKVDSRSLVYPIARALSMNGLVGIITDDGAYRRLYPGYADIGIVSGVDIAVCDKVDEDAIHKLDSTGVPYDTLIIVSGNFIHPESNGVVACHGLNRTMMAKDEEEDDDDFFIPILPKSNEEEEAKPKKKSKPSKKSEELEESSLEGMENQPVEETEHDRLLKAQKANPNVIVVPKNMPFVEVQVAYAPAPKNKNILGIPLKEMLIRYIYDCEEENELKIINDKPLNSLYAEIISKCLDIPKSEASVLLVKVEGKGDILKKK